MPAVRVLPSLLSADFGHLADQLAMCKDHGAKVLHVDVMDGSFVPNLTLGPFIVDAIRKNTDLELDVHLMIDEPVRYAQAYRDAGSDAITFHVEAVNPRTVDHDIDAVAATGAKVGLAFKPDTDPTMWFDQIARVDRVMLMTVYPGFGGQKFIPEVRPRVRAVRERFPDIHILVDGGIGRDTAADIVADGANLLVAGSAFFGDPDKADFITWAEGLG